MTLDARIRAEIRRRHGVVPSCRRMAACVGASAPTVSKAYVRLHLTPTTATRAEPSMYLRVPDEAYDQICRLARKRGVSVARIARSLLVSATKAANNSVS